MKRWASSTSDISSEKKATGMSLLHRDVFGDVGDQGAVVDDDVVGDEVAQARNVEVVGLFFPHVLDRLDLVPPDVGVAELLERGRGDGRRQLCDEAAGRGSARRRASCGCAAVR